MVGKGGYVNPGGDETGTGAGLIFSRDVEGYGVVTFLYVV